MPVPTCIYSKRSLSARRAWIEITYVIRLPRCQVVALRKESGDRNRCARLVAGRPNVALRKESVDRNVIIVNALVCQKWSLSARRAWIEINFP